MLNQLMIMTFVFGNAEEKSEDIRSFPPDLSLSIWAIYLGNRWIQVPLFQVKSLVFPENTWNLMKGLSK